jgi:hypothetical protein
MSAGMPAFILEKRRHPRDYPESPAQVGLSLVQGVA